MTVDEIVKEGEAWGKGILQTLGENGGMEGTLRLQARLQGTAVML